MTIQLVSIDKQADDRYSVTVQDTGDVTGKDENNADVYRTYSLLYNPATGKEALKKNIEALISANKKTATAENTVETDIKTTVESIDTLKIGA